MSFRRCVDAEIIAPSTRFYDPSVPYDEDLAERLRVALTTEPDVTERKMFGGVALLVRGHMAVVASHAGGLMVRTDPADQAELVRTTSAEPMEMNGRPMKGWLVMDAAAVHDDDELDAWVQRALAYNRTLPQKH
jgi:TfoX/Sxy family transcriptional regulator of competence genes